MKTVADILKESGLSDDQIKTIDEKAMQGLNAYAEQANKALEAAELAKRSQAEMYDKEIAPALDRWANEKAAQDTKVAAYEAALKAAKEGGFQVPDILQPQAQPNPAAGRDASGRFVTGANPVPGSPGLVEDLTKFKQDAAAAIGTIADLQWRYRTLFGKEMPDAPTQLIREAQSQKLDPVAYATKKYQFAEREAQIKADEQKKHDEAIRAEVAAAKDKEWSEKVGTNPNLRIAQESTFSSVTKAMQTGQRKDPLKMTAEERKTNTHAEIGKAIAERAATA